MTAPKAILDLVDRFREHRQAYLTPAYNEAQLRREFLDPFFDALGWDMHNRQGYAEGYKEVIHEDSLAVEGSARAPDYCFRVGGRRVFFVEAKKPSVNLKEDVSPAFQLRRYAWSAGLPLSILTDFHEFAVYDCRVKPDHRDKASTARILYLTFDEYADRWEEIAGIFSREAVLKGAFDAFAGAGRKKGTTGVDDAFLSEIEGWRDLLARNLALRNPDLTVDELNFAVQRTIDRIIFLRICEDRGIEEYGRLQALVNGANVYDRLRGLFREADERFNSGLFHFHAEKGRAESPDTLTPRLALDDKPLKEIIRNLYYPDSPYEFSALPADILGQVYEQFLGKVIRLTAGHQAKVEEKPEVKKAGGVFYTPTWVVEYIVRSTVGRLLDGKTPKEAERLRILDPACGSGSFLIGAYQHLLDWHRDWYVAHDPGTRAGGRNPVLCQAGADEWRLTTPERKRILLNSIYGVDIDRQAVEVTKLSLLLKVLEGETGQTLARQLRIFHERALPDLGSNIKCGNSLIGPDFFDGQLTPPTPEEQARVNPFDWSDEFPAIMNSGGFDAVIGNPPYIRIQTLKEWAPLEVEFYKGRYRAASAGNYDIYTVFVERGLELLGTHGLLGFILPHKFFNAKYGEPLRAVISKGSHLAEVVHFGDQQVFKGATTYTCLLFLDKAGRKEFSFAKVDDLAAWRVATAHEATSSAKPSKSAKPTEEAGQGTIPAARAGAAEWNFTVGRGAALMERLREMPVKLGDVAERMAQGIRTSANEVYVLDLVSEKGRLLVAHSKQLGRDVTLDRDSVAFFLQGREIKPYRVLHSGKLVIVPYSLTQGSAVLMAEGLLREKYTHTFSYLLENKAYLEAREKGRFKGKSWYGFGRLQNIDLMLLPKILVPDIADRASFALDEEGRYAFTSGYGITLKPSTTISPKFLLGLLNSSLLNYFLRQVSTTIRGGFFRYFTQYIEQLPIRVIDFSDPADKRRHDEMVALVERMLDLHKSLPSAHEHDRTLIERRIKDTDRRIDRLVYDLYALTAPEIAIIEGGSAR
jgi:type I restriction-modification system DNA methylase subunit